MKQKRLIDWPYVIGLILLPLAILLVLFVIKFVQDFTRYDDSFFYGGVPGALRLA